MSAETPPEQPAAAGRLQFGLRDALGSVVTISLLCAYLRTFGPDKVYRGGAVLLAAAVLGGLAGAVSRNAIEGAFWAVIGAAWAYLAVVTAFVLPAMQLLWPLIGTVAGAATGAAAAQARRPWSLIVLGAMAAGTVFLVWTFMLFVFGTALDLIFDFCCAVLAGGGLGGVVYLSRWVEDRARIPRFVLAMLLIALAIGVSWGGQQFVKGW